MEAKIVWLCVVAVMAVIVIVGTVKSFLRHKGVHAGLRQHLLGFARERDEIWVPGDRPLGAEERDDYEDDDDF